MEFLRRKRKEPKFEVATRGEGTVKLTARELAERVEKDAAASDYDWIAGPAELLIVVIEENFDSKCRERILVCMINCYAHLLRPTCDIYSADYLAATAILDVLAQCRGKQAIAATENYFAQFAYRATREPMRWAKFGEFGGPMAQAHVDEWCKQKGKELVKKLRDAAPHAEALVIQAPGNEQFLPGSPLMQQLEKEFSEELKRMRESGEFDAENAAQEEAYAKLARATMGLDDHEIYHGEMS